jgi:hypothetical protein
VALDDALVDLVAVDAVDGVEDLRLGQPPAAATTRSRPSATSATPSSGERLFVSANADRSALTDVALDDALVDLVAVDAVDGVEDLRLGQPPAAVAHRLGHDPIEAKRYIGYTFVG